MDRRRHVECYLYDEARSRHQPGSATSPPVRACKRLLLSELTRSSDRRPIDRRERREHARLPPPDRNSDSARLPYLRRPDYSFQDIVHLITTEMREELERVVLEAYRRECTQGDADGAGDYTASRASQGGGL